ncbi:MAG: J domain-containing protein [Pirellulales bacterium]
MDEDYYSILGVSRSASESEIQKAYRKLAAKYHPDMNQGNKKAKETFQKVQKAYEVLNDPQTRKLYDQYGSAYEAVASGAAPEGWRPGGGAGGAGPDIDFSQFFGGQQAGGGDPFGAFGDIFRQFGQGGAAGGGPGPGAGRRGGRRPTHRGANIESEVEIPFRDAILGGEVSLRLHRPGGQAETVSVRVPQGVAEGQTIRLRGQGEPGGGMPGDLLLTVRIAPHSFYTRRDLDLIVRVPVTLGEAVNGGKIDVPTPWGEISVKVPPGTSSGKRLRIKGHGVKNAKGQAGDLFVELHIALPDQLDETHREAARRFDSAYRESPRQELSW